MTAPITPQQFHDVDGVADSDWRVLLEGACAHFRTGSFATGVALVDAIGALADAADHHPDVDLRYAGATGRLTTREVSGRTHRRAARLRRDSRRARLAPGRGLPLQGVPAHRRQRGVGAPLYAERDLSTLATQD